MQNSDATELLKINDDGEVFFGDVGNDTKISLRRSSAGTIMGSIEAIGNGLYLSGFQGNSNILFGRNSSEGITINNGQTRLAASLGVKGLGSTSATTALLVQNSAGTRIMEAQDGGNIFFGASTSHYLQNGYNWFGSYYFINTQTFRGALQNDLGSVKISDDLNVGGNVNNDTGVRLQVKGSGATSATTALLVQNSAASELFKVNDDGYIYFPQANWYTYTAGPTILRSTNGGGFRFFTGGDAMEIQSTGVGIGTNSPAAKTHIKGSGATSATTALLVQNSAGVNLLTMKDNGDFTTTTSNFSSVLTNSGSGFKVEGSVAAIRVGGSVSANASAILQADSTTQGFLPPRMTTAQKTAIATPAAGLMVYDTDQNQMNYYNGTGWIAI